MSLTAATLYPRLARLALACIDRAWPYAAQHVHTAPGDRGMRLHPAFGGCFDWHSAVHAHWSLVRIMRLQPRAEVNARAAAVLSRHLTPTAVAAEIVYLHRPEARFFEAPYGWAWLLALAAELTRLEQRSETGSITPRMQPELRHRRQYAAPAARWRTALAPLADLLTARAVAYFHRLPAPIRGGLHPNSAFSLALMLDALGASGKAAAAASLAATARRLFLADTGCPTRYEPSGSDFLSPCLAEAELMRRVLPPAAYRAWLHRFLPPAALRALLVPLPAPAVGDPQSTHLLGLIFHRAWCLHAIARDFGATSQPWQSAARRAHRDAEAAASAAFNGGYAVSHWLGTFLLYFHSESFDTDTRE